MNYKKYFKEFFQNEAERQASKLVSPDCIQKFYARLKSKTACFTGHRAQKLPWGFNEKDERCKAMKANLKAEIEKAIACGYNRFICGMALGFDMICAETLLKLKKKHEIYLEGAIPCKNQESKWSKEYKARYKKLLKKLNTVYYVSEEYTGVECMLERNRYMVDNSSLIIALFNGNDGGTKYTVDYARQQGLKIVLIEP